MPSPESLVLAVAGPGECNGIGDYAWHLSQALHPAELIVRGRTVASWRELNTPEWTARGAAARGVFVQYFPQAYVGPDFAPLIEWLGARRRAGGRVTVTLHEYWPHFSISPRRLIMRRRSVRALRDLVTVSTAMVVSQPYSASELNASGLVPSDMVHVIPVGSAVPVVPLEPLVPKVPVEPVERFVPVIVIFGQPAMMDRAAVTAVARWVDAQTDGTELWWFSRSEPELHEWWRRAVGTPGARVRFHGGLQARELSQLLQRASIGLALYVDGASMRRSSLAALLEHGLPIVARDDRYTDDRLRQSGAFAFVPADGADRLPGAIAGVLSDPAMRAGMSAAAIRLFDQLLAWPRIAAQYRALDPVDHA